MPVYLDNAATTPVCPQAAQAAYDVLVNEFGNPSAQYSAGKEAARLLKERRSIVADALGCKPDELYFTSCGSEGDNWSIRAALHYNRRVGKHIITSAIEHSAVLETVKDLVSQGYEATILKPDRTGHILLSDIEAALRPDTALVSMMLVNNELGTVQPVAETAKLLRSRGSSALLHCDAVQAFLKIPFTPAGLGVDLLSISGHKIGAPKGIGAQYIRSGLKLPPLIRGGGQESGLRSGTEATAQIAALAAACQNWNDGSRERLRSIHSYALETLQTVPGLQLVSAGDAPHICTVSLPGFPSEMLVRDLSDRGIFVSSGSACHRGKPSHVLAALGLPKLTLMGTLRVSFSPETTREDIDALRDALTDITRTRLSRS